MEPNDSIRKPAVAGSFYPRDPQTLQQQINDMLTGAQNAPADDIITGRIFGLIVPMPAIYTPDTSRRTLTN
ncbi:MAG: AmmeMemoRadiSam system protein B [Candidatus Latescibacterota bacterium]